MRKLLPFTGAFLSIYAVTSAAPVIAQDAGAFADVPATSPAYRVATELQQKDIVTGYPLGYFSGKKTLTRYEFAVVLQRALDKLQYSGQSSAEDLPSVAAPIGTGEAPISAELVVHVQSLVEEFKKELKGLGTNLKEVSDRLDQLARRLNGASNHGVSSGQFDFHILPPAHDDQSGINPQGGNPPDFNLLGPVGAKRGGDGFDFGSATGGSVFQNARPTTLMNQLTRSLSVSGVEASRDKLFNLSASGIAAVPGGLLGSQDTELHLTVPLSDRSVLGMSMRDTLVADDLLATNPYRNLAYGTSISVHPRGRLMLGAEAVRNVTELPSTDGVASSYLDSNAYLIKLGYKTGPASAVIGYRLGDTLAAMNTNLNRTLTGLNPASGVQGPYTQLAMRFSDHLQSYVGGDFYGNTGYRYGAMDPALSPLLIGNVYRGTAGIRWNPTRKINLTADFEGLLYDLSGAVSSSGRRLQPVEQYITLGAGLDLPGNAILKMAYRIYNQQDTLGGDGSSSQSHASVFTTQLGIRF